ncbi:MAG: hypothetical protein NTX65_12635 [Ignavibacteriales bacterium]|nr:hypothetical protein [Ignavibacteriales bacterium]
MKNTLIISYDFFRKVLSLAEYLEHSSQSLICLIGELEKNNAYEKHSMKNLNSELSSLNNRAHKIKEELVYAAVHQEGVMSNDEPFKNSFKKLSEDFKKINAICEEIAEPIYFINEKGKLTK